MQQKKMNRIHRKKPCRLFRFLAALLLVLLSLSFSYAETPEELFAADQLYVLGLFQGTGTDPYGNPVYELDSPVTREQGLTTVVRLLGKEEEALGYTGELPFTDVSDWAKPYVSYGYYLGLTKGVSESLFGSGEAVTLRQFYTFMLRALGYGDDGDFSYESAREKAEELGLSIQSGEGFTRGDMVRIAVLTLDSPIKGSKVTLLETCSSVTERQLYDWRNVIRSYSNRAEAEALYPVTKTLDTGLYEIPEALGGKTLSFQEAFSLVGRAPVIIKNRVKTFEDLLQYSVAAGFGAGNEAFTPWYGTEEEAWGFDYRGDYEIGINWYNCCGGASNYVGYLLEGDYDALGWIQYLGDLNHHFNWVKKDGIYYFLDLTKFANRGDYLAAGLNRETTAVISAGSIEAFYREKWPSYYGSKDGYTHVFYAEETETSPADFRQDKLVYHSSLKDKITLLYVKEGENTVFQFGEPGAQIPGFTSFTEREPDFDALKIRAIVAGCEREKEGRRLP